VARRTTGLSGETRPVYRFCLMSTYASNTDQPLATLEVLRARASWQDPEWFRDIEHAEEQCREYLAALRWPDGVSCPRCRSNQTSWPTARKRFWCRECKYQFSVTTGTLLHNSHAPVWKWFLAVHLLVESDGGLPAHRLAKQLGGSYRTAWFIEHRVRAALKASAEPSGAPEPIAADHDRTNDERVYDRAVVGAYHQQSAKHMAAYRAEREWLARHAGNPYRFRDTVLALIAGDPLSYEQLIRRPVGIVRAAVLPVA